MTGGTGGGGEGCGGGGDGTGGESGSRSQTAKVRLLGAWGSRPSGSGASSAPSCTPHAASPSSSAEPPRGAQSAPRQAYSVGLKPSVGRMTGARVMWEVATAGNSAGPMAGMEGLIVMALSVRLAGSDASLSLAASGGSRLTVAVNISTERTSRVGIRGEGPSAILDAASPAASSVADAAKATSNEALGGTPGRAPAVETTDPAAAASGCAATASVSCPVSKSTGAMPARSSAPAADARAATAAREASSRAWSRWPPPAPHPVAALTMTALMRPAPQRSPRSDKASPPPSSPVSMSRPADAVLMSTAVGSASSAASTQTSWLERASWRRPTADSSMAASATSTVTPSSADRLQVPSGSSGALPPYRPAYTSRNCEAMETSPTASAGVRPRFTARRACVASSCSLCNRRRRSVGGGPSWNSCGKTARAAAPSGESTYAITMWLPSGRMASSATLPAGVRPR
mmetsp:Transcript_25555/g.66324  ORF Transcript_25555/g.66324 Transcript_25555/m.66324 type:complete len:460 (-) Transcript_25555:1268-2647(-)